MTAVVATTDLSKRFRSHTALQDLDLRVPEGSVYGLIGPNGAGKSTTLKILMNILQPSSGTAEVLGTDSRRLGPGDLMRIGYVAESQELPPWMTVEYLLSYLKPFYPTWDSDRASGLLRRFELPYGRKIGNLSRGMRMKTALVSSLAFRPGLLLLDEPFSGLDPAVRDDLIEALAESAGETTIVISSHDLAEIETFASHIAYIDHGRIRLAAEMQSLNDQFREVEVTLPNAGPVGEDWPAHWLCPERTGSLVRFVDSQFDRDATPGVIGRVFGTHAQVTTAPMPLRAIFVAMARSRKYAD